MNKELLLSNILLDGLLRLNLRLKNVCLANGFGTWEQYILNPSNYELETYKCIMIILDGESLKSMYGESDRVCELLDQIEKFAIQNRDIKIYLSNIALRFKCVLSLNEMEEMEAYENKINNAIYGICDCNSNITCLNIKKIVLQMGESKVYSKKLEYLSSCPYSIDMLKAIAEEINSVDYFKICQCKKCLVLDLDNTLWGGVVGEDGRDNIQICASKEGKQYFDFQKIVKKIVSSGTILAIASKNNENDITGIFSELNMPLQEKDFVVKKINWQPKSISIMEICNELNIGLDSVVFVDDSAVEREEVKRQLPMVEVPEFPKDPSQLEEFGLFLYRKYFSTDSILLEDLQKTEMYQANIKRDALKKKSIDIDSFLKELDIKLIIEKAQEKHVQRISQMTQKTNQFNITTKRYNEQEIGSMITDSSTMIFVCKVVDKYGSNGITNLCILKFNDNDVFIDEFLMSCRVMERRIEYDFLAYIENTMYDLGKENLVGSFIPTSKNGPASTFYSAYGFKRMESSDEKINYCKKIERKKYSDLMLIDIENALGE